MKNTECCNQDCNQGRNCPVRMGTYKPAEAVHEIAEPKTQQPEALRLAHTFDHPLPPEWEDMKAAAAELRRQHARIVELESQLAAAQPAAQGMEKDAARYRWLRNRMLAVDFDWCENGITALAFEMPDGCAYGGDCDQNIDAAIAAKAKQGA